MTLFTVTVYVLFHFGLDRDSLDGELASGVLWVTLLLAAVIGVTRLFAAEREQGGIDALLLAPVDRTALFLAKAAALFLYLVALELVAVPAFGLLLLGPDLLDALPELLLILLLADVGLAAVGALVSALAAETRARELIVPLLLLPLLVPLLIGAASATEPLLRGAQSPEDLGPLPGAAGRLRRGVRADRPGGLRLPAGRLSRCLTVPWGRVLQGLQAAGRGHRRDHGRSRSRSCSSTRRSTPTRASSRRSSTCTCRWRSWRCAASWPAGSWPSSTCARGDRSWDMRSYVAIHMSIILGIGVLITGAIWAKAAWGHWWVWDEPVLVSFLVVFLLYCVYYPLRFSIEDPERQARYSSVFAIAAGAFVPINFVAVRLAESFTHPRVLSQTGGSLPGDMRLTFLVCILAMTLLFVTLWKLELTSKHASMQLKRLRARLEAGAA